MPARKAPSAIEAPLELVVVPHTLRATRLCDARPGDRVNIEVDVLARYVARQLALGRSPVSLGPGAGGGDKDASHDARSAAPSTSDGDADARIRRKLLEGGYG